MNCSSRFKSTWSACRAPTWPQASRSRRAGPWPPSSSPARCGASASENTRRSAVDPPREDKMYRYLDIYWLMVRYSLIREMNFKANFLLWMVVELLWFMGQIVFIEVLFQYVDAIGDWS